MSQKLHAQHNERVCGILKAATGCNDWVVTTAFYSALHYVQYDMFPYHDTMRAYQTFESYYNAQRIMGERSSRHLVTVDLVNEFLQDCGASYQFLYQTCMTARYQNYKVPELVVDSAIRHLNHIKGTLVK